MIESADTFLDKLRLLIVILLIVAALSLLPLLLSQLLTTAKAQTLHSDSANIKTANIIEDNPNVIAAGMTSAADGLGKITSSTERTINNSFHAVTNSIVTATTQSGKFVAHGLGSSVAFIAHVTSNTVGFITDTSKASAIIRPVEADKTPVPVIEASAKTQADLSAKEDVKNKLQPSVDSKASWPIHGVVTLEFGVPHWPYQPTHTGIDISDGRPAGVTPIHPFLPGKVVEAVYSNAGFGNHVVVDHGRGITSLYGHLASISVHVGQKVDKNTTLGREGSTGASTGTHLHFEIRLNGQPIDPRRYIKTQP